MARCRPSMLDKLVQPQSMWSWDFSQEWVALFIQPWWPRGILSPQSQESSISRTFCPTMTTLIDRIKLRTVARHQNDKVSVSPSLILKSGKKKKRVKFSLSVSWGCLALQVSLKCSGQLPGYPWRCLLKRRRIDMYIAPVMCQVFYKCQSLNLTAVLCLGILSTSFSSFFFQQSHR